MRVERDCDTCRYNLDGVCTAEHYGKTIEDLVGSLRDCWQPSFEYMRKIINALPREMQEEISPHCLNITKLLKHYEELPETPAIIALIDDALAMTSNTLLADKLVEIRGYAVELENDITYWRKELDDAVKHYESKIEELEEER